MCGLTGYISANPKPELLDISRGLMVANQDRGTDSSGVALFSENRTEIIKNTQSSREFILSNWKYIESVKPGILLGHTRYAVIGAVNQKNAQPFTSGRITGTHNGVISNWTTLDPLVEVDSEVIFKLLDSKIEPSKSLKKLQGSLAVVWHDDNDPDAVYMVKHENPLSVAYVKPLKAWVWNSEEIPLMAVLHTLYNPSNFTVYELEEDYIYRIDNTGKVKKNRVKFKKTSYPTTVSSSTYLDKYYEDNYGVKQTVYQTGDDYYPDIQDEAEKNGCDQCGAMIQKYDSFYSDGYGIYCSRCGANRRGCEKYSMY